MKSKHTFFSSTIHPLLATIVLILLWIASGQLKKNTNIICHFLASTLSLNKSPILDGGNILSRIECGINDLSVDSSFFNNNNGLSSSQFDIINYYIHNPLKSIAGYSLWNIDIELYDLPADQNSSTGFKHISGGIFIDIIDSTDSETNSNTRNSCIISFDTLNFKWDYHITFDSHHIKGTMFSAASGRYYKIDITSFKKRNIIRISIPLVENITSDIDTSSTGKHFAYISATGFDSSFSESGFPFIDCTPYISTADGFIRPLLQATASHENSICITEADIDDLHSIAQSISAPSYQQEIVPILKEGILYLNNDKFEKALSLLNTCDDSPLCLSYLSLATAGKAGNERSVGKKIRLVHTAFNQMKKALSGTLSESDRFYIYRNAVTLYSQTPEKIFHQSGNALLYLDKLLKMDINKHERASFLLKKRKILLKLHLLRELRILDFEIHSFLGKTD